MKNLLRASAWLGLVLGTTLYAQSALIDLGGGLIYDDDFDVTWLQDANYAKTSGFHPTGEMTWDDAVNWAANLVYAGFDDWRLPSALNSDGSGPTVGSIHEPPIPNDSELGHLYYIELDNEGFNSNPYNAGPFVNVSFGDTSTDWHWAAEPDPGNFLVSIFRFANGYQGYDSRTAAYHAWPVHDGRIEFLGGDLNSDGFVGQDDLNLVLAKWGQTVAAGDPADPNGDLFIGQDDLNPVLGDWGQGTPLAVGSLRTVPESASLVLLLMGIAVLWPALRLRREAL